MDYSEIIPETVLVAFDERVQDWENFADGLNKSLPSGFAVALGVNGEPLMHHDFCRFIHRLEMPWSLRTSLFGPGYHCLRANYSVLGKRCIEITTVFSPNEHAGLYPWLRKVGLLARIGYNLRVETEAEPDERYVRNVTHGLVNLQIDVVKPTFPLRKGYRREARSCNGELACILSDGRYYPCPHCWDVGPLGSPVYRYGQLGEHFERKGRENCKLKDCPLEQGI